MHHLYFFFSSRRRHTRSLCDWSSDVCSSDLLGLRRKRRGGLQRVERRHGAGQGVGRGRHGVLFGHRLAGFQFRSEERRVGKECRSRGAAYSENNKREQTKGNVCVASATLSVV